MTTKRYDQDPRFRELRSLMSQVLIDKGLGHIPDDAITWNLAFQALKHLDSVDAQPEPLFKGTLFEFTGDGRAAMIRRMDANGWPLLARKGLRNTDVVVYPAGSATSEPLFRAKVEWAYPGFPGGIRLRDATGQAPNPGDRIVCYREDKND